MKLTLLAVGTRSPAWVAAACADYQKRFPPTLPLIISAVPTAHRAGGNPAAARAREGALLLQRLPPRARAVRLDEHGPQYTSAELARRLAAWREDARDTVFLIGGPDGFDAAVTARVPDSWALSRLTLPHQLVRVMAVEALYRAWSICAGLPYHRGTM